MMNEPTDADLEIQRLRGELLVVERETRAEACAEYRHTIDWFAAMADYWRRRYIGEHPELDNWDAVEEVENEEWGRLQMERGQEGAQ